MKNRAATRQKEYLRKLYASERRLKNRVLLHERYVASAVASHLGISNVNPKRKPSLYSDLEWLLTWKLKTGICPRLMWCDGLEGLKLKNIGNYRIAFKSDIWIGPEDGSGNRTKGIIEGEIEVRHTGKQLKNYLMEIQHENSTYVARKLNKLGFRGFSVQKDI